MAALIPAAVGLIGGAAGYASEQGKDRFKSKDYTSDPRYDANAFEYGGAPGVAGAEQDRYDAMGRGMHYQGEGYANIGAAGQNRMGVSMDPAQMAQSRDAQMSALNLQREAAMGTQPSVAAIQQNMGLQQARAAQQSMAASTRGGAMAQASANRQAMNNAATMQAGGVQQAAMLRAQEMENARAGYLGGSNALRGSDFQQAQYGAHLQDAQRGRNDALQMGMTNAQVGMTNARMQAEGMRRGVFQDANQGRMGRQAFQAGEHARVEGITAGISGRNAANEKDNFGRMLDSVSGAAGAGGKALGGGGGSGADSSGNPTSRYPT